MGVAIFENQLFRLEVEHGIARIIRTATPLEIATLPERVAELGRALERTTARAALMDMRNAPGRNDPEFEAATVSWRRLIGTRFPKLAILVRTQAGRLQIQRLGREDRRESHVFLDEAEALRYLASE
jgi:hypothetical protein